MTAYQHVHLGCDGRSGDLICDERFEAPSELGFVPVAVTRQVARQAGWTHIPHPRTRELDRDLCPDHKETPGA